MSDWHTNINRLRTVRIENIQWENVRTKTFFFHDELCSSAKPGQFIMMWIPGVDEIPLSLSSAEIGGLCSVTVAEIGDATRALGTMKSCDLIDVRGPFGNCFRIKGREALVVGGGSGMASLLRLTVELKKAEVKTTVVEGAETKDQLLFIEQIRKLGIELIIMTDDGSYGTKGMATEGAEEVLASRKFDTIYTCGPEKMIAKIYFLAKRYNTPLQTCLERLMRCGIGICGSCAIGKYRVCKDGPVFDQSQLAMVENELGIFRFDFSGKRMTI